MAWVSGDVANRRILADMGVETANGLRRGLSVLDVLAGEEAVGRGGLGVVELARELGVDKSQASRTLKTLAEHGVVERDPRTRCYRLGARLFTYAAVVSGQRLLELAPPLLRRLVSSLGERSHLSVLDGTSVLTLLSESPPHALQAAGWAGRRVPAHLTASGRALLFDEDVEALRERFAGVQFGVGGPRVASDVEEFVRRVVAARAVGYAIVDEEFEAGLVAVAAPVRNFDGRIVGAMNVSAPTFRFRERLGVGGLEVRAAGAELSALLAGAQDGQARTG